MLQFLGVVAIIAIAAPIGVAVTNSPKINNLESELNQIREKTIGGLKPTQTLIDLVELSQTNRETQTTALSRLNAVENKSTLFTVVNENGNELANAITNDPIPNITGFQRSIDKKNWEFLVRVNWNLSQDYIIPHSFYNNGVPLVWGPAAQEEISAKDNYNEILNEMDLSSAIFDGTQLSFVFKLDTIFNTDAGKVKLASAFNNGDSIIIESFRFLPSTQVQNPIGATLIELNYSWKDGKDLFTYAIFNSIDHFLINLSKIGDFKEGYEGAIQEIEGVADATDANSLEAILNTQASKIVILNQINWNPQIGSTRKIISDITVNGQTGNYTINIPINVDFFSGPDLVITDFNEKG